MAFREALRLDRYLLLHPDLLRYMKNRWAAPGKGRGGGGACCAQPPDGGGGCSRFLRSSTLDTAQWRIYRPSTGALLLLTALQLCDKARSGRGRGSGVPRRPGPAPRPGGGWGAPQRTDLRRGQESDAGRFSPTPTQVSAYGFITAGHERFSDHYYDRAWKQTVFYINHDFGLERALWKRLHDEGIIRLYQRPAAPQRRV